MKFAFFTLGCKVNLFETQALSQLAAERGHEIVDSGADAVIINTCTVTSSPTIKISARSTDSAGTTPARSSRRAAALRRSTRSAYRRPARSISSAARGPRTDH